MWQFPSNSSQLQEEFTTTNSKNYFSPSTILQSWKLAECNGKLITCLMNDHTATMECSYLAVCSDWLLMNDFIG